MVKWNDGGFMIIFILIEIVIGLNALENDIEEPPEGYYAFVESPNAEPPRVRPPPYTHVYYDCREDDSKSPQGSLFNLCGDLNKGNIPRNPMGQNVLGSPYPFELIRNMTLKYLSRTLPILKADETLPKVAQMQDFYINQNSLYHSYQSNDRKDRVKRQATSINSTSTPSPSSSSSSSSSSTSSSPSSSSFTPFSSSLSSSSSSSSSSSPSSSSLKQSSSSSSSSRQSRKFCDQGGVFCMLYKAINGESITNSESSQLPLERRDEVPLTPRYEGPPTPCPAKVEYATPVFAKNYQGVWRYVVQIPYEGYFTQTVEVTRCLQSRCHYLEGGCLSSPRWSSLLVAEIYYPDTVLSNSDTVNPQRNPVAASQPPSVQDFQNYQQYLQKRAGLQPDVVTTQRPSSQCDGIDALGCFQVRLYYDWFLIPGSCKCWRPDYFNKYVRRKSNQDL